MGTIAQDFTTDAVISYATGNGTYTFSPAANLLKVSHKPILDQAKRAVTHTLHTYIIEDTLQATDQLDGTKVDTTTIRQILNVPGGLLRVIGVGVGSFAVNFGTGRDLMWGPIPTELSWENYGNGKAGKIVWQVQCATAEMCGNAASTRQPMAYCYDAAFSKDRSGYGRRVIAGYIEIPITRSQQNIRTSPDNVDRLRESCYPDVPIGWKRTDDSWKVSMDRRRADFSYTDEEQPVHANAPGVIDCEETHSAQSEGPAFVVWSGQLSGTYEMTKARQRSEAWEHFTKFCKSRIDGLRKVDNVTCIIPRKIQLEESIHSRTSGVFTLDYTYVINSFDVKNPTAGGQLPTQGLDRALANSGLYAALGEDNYTDWKKSMTKDGVFTARGPAKTAFSGSASSDLIIDLCLSQPVTTQPLKVSVAAPQRINSKATIPFPTPPADAGSILHYQFGIHVSGWDTTVELKPLPTTPLSSVSAPVKVIGGQNGQAAGVGGFVDLPYSNTPTSVFQDRAGNLVAVTLYGTAMRAGYPLSAPVLLGFGGQPAKRQNGPGDFFRTWLAGNLGVPIVASAWSQRYLLPAPPASGFVAPDNPLYGSLTGGQSLQRISTGGGGTRIG